MALQLEADKVLSAIIDGLPKVAELISTVPEERRERALEAAEQRSSKGPLRSDKGAGLVARTLAERLRSATISM